MYIHLHTSWALTTYVRIMLKAKSACGKRYRSAKTAQHDQWAGHHELWCTMVARKCEGRNCVFKMKSLRCQWRCGTFTMLCCAAQRRSFRNQTHQMRHSRPIDTVSLSMSLRLQPSCTVAFQSPSTKGYSMPVADIDNASHST